MGGKGIYDFIKKKCPNAIFKSTMENMRGITVVVDSSHVLNIFGRSIRKKNSDNFKTSTGKDKEHIYTMITTVRICIEHGILPINVFDGSSPYIKKNVVDKRIKDSVTAKQELDDLMKKSKSNNLSENEIKKLGKLRSKSYKLDRIKVNECCKLLSLLGMPHLVAFEEADPQCSMLERNNNLDVFGVVGEDSDLLAYGSKILLRNFKKKQEILIYSLKQILKDLKLSFNDFVDIFIYSGVDYCKNIPGMGINKAYDIYKELKNNDICKINEAIYIPGFDNLSLENKEKIKDYNYHNIFRSLLYIYKYKPEIKIPNNYLENFIIARDRYTNTCEGYDPQYFDSTWKKPKYELIKLYLLEEFEFDNNTVNSFINIIEKNYKYYNKINPNKNKFRNFQSYCEKDKRIKNNKN